MRNFIILLAVLSLAAPVFAGGVEDGQALYVGGTIPGLAEGTPGRLVTTNEHVLVFEHSGGALGIPYLQIRSCRYEARLARRLGVLPTIAVGLLKRLQRRHIIQISYLGPDGVVQAAVFEVSKHDAQPVYAALVARSPRPCRPKRDENGEMTTASAVPCRQILPFAN